MVNGQVGWRVANVVIAIGRIGDRALLNLVGHAACAAGLTGGAGQAAAQGVAAPQARACARGARGVGVGQGRVGVAIGFALGVCRYRDRAAGNADCVVVGGEGDGVVASLAACRATGAQRNVIAAHNGARFAGQRAGDICQAVVYRVAVPCGGQTNAGTTRVRSNGQRRIIFAIHLGGGTGRQGDRALRNRQVVRRKADGVVTVGNRALCNGIGAARDRLACAAGEAAGKGVGAHAPASAACGFHGVGQAGVGIAIHLGLRVGRQGDGALGNGQRAGHIGERIIAGGVVTTWHDGVATCAVVGCTLCGATIGQRAGQHGLGLTKLKRAVGHAIATRIRHAVVGFAGSNCRHGEWCLPHRQIAVVVGDGVVAGVKAAGTRGGAGHDGVVARVGGVHGTGAGERHAGNRVAVFR